MFLSAVRGNNGDTSTTWTSQILRPDGAIFYQTTRYSIKSCSVVFLTCCQKLYDDVPLSRDVVSSMKEILTETGHLDSIFQRGDRNFEVVFGLPLTPDEVSEDKGRPIIYSYIFNVNTQTLSWPKRGVDIWSDILIGGPEFRADRLVDIGTLNTSSISVELPFH